MIGLVLVAHGRLAQELLSAAEHVVGRQQNVEAVCVELDVDLIQQKADIRRCIELVDAGEGVMILIDMFGSTPSNLAISQMDRPGVEVISGMNLPMLVKFFKVRSTLLLVKAVDISIAAGQKYIAAASHVFKEVELERAVGSAYPAIVTRNTSEGRSYGRGGTDSGGADHPSVTLTRVAAAAAQPGGAW